MLVTSATMSTAAKYADLVYKITFLQNCTFNVNPAFVSFLLPSVGSCKYTLTNYNSSFMKYLLILLVFPFLSASECGKKKEKENVTEQDLNGASNNDSIPVCVRRLIDSANKEIPPNPPLQVDEYLYNGKKVFLVTAPCCDFFNMVYDDSCKAVCAPSGGITGKGDGKCEDFATTAKFVKSIWKNTEK